MFQGCEKFRNKLPEWYTSNLKIGDMCYINLSKQSSPRQDSPKLASNTSISRS